MRLSHEQPCRNYMSKMPGANFGHLLHSCRAMGLAPTRASPTVAILRQMRKMPLATSAHLRNFSEESNRPLARAG
jgi:hypothetical protein